MPRSCPAPGRLPPSPPEDRAMIPSTSPDVLLDAEGPFPLPDHAYYGAWDPQGPLQAPGGGEDEDDLLLLLIDPNVACDPHGPESDSGISDDPRAESPNPRYAEAQGPSSTAVCEVVCDSGGAPFPDVAFAGTLGTWTPQTIIPGDGAPSAEQALTEEEHRLLAQEGVSLQGGRPLSKVEERILKKVRRKIRNKRSAQDSRRRKKEYVNGLENRAAACVVQNQELRKKVQDLEVQNSSLLAQLQKLHGLIKQTSPKAAQTSTCLLLLLFWLGLFLLPSGRAFFGGTQLSRQGYKPSRGKSTLPDLTQFHPQAEEGLAVWRGLRICFPSPVISRHILHQGSLPDSEGDDGTAEGADGTKDRVPEQKAWAKASAPEPLRNNTTQEENGLVEKDPERQSHADEM
nr:cyclic AMP-responsive element-binding protein 3-like protein 4 [Anolis sagrei ordinatus]